MNTLMNIFLVAKTTLPKGKTPMEMYDDFGPAIAVFLAFLLILFLIISPGKTKKARSRNK